MTSLQIHPESASLLRSIGLLPPEEDYGESASDRGGYGYQDDELQQQRAQQPMSAPQPQRRFEDQEEAIPRPVRRDVAGIHAILSADQMCVAFPAPPHPRNDFDCPRKQCFAWASATRATGRGAGRGAGRHSALLILLLHHHLLLILSTFLQSGCHSITQTEFPIPQAGMS